MIRSLSACLTSFGFLLQAAPIAAQVDPAGARPGVGQFYFSTGIGKAFVPDAYCLNLAQALVLSNHWGASLSWKNVVYRSDALPRDYQSGSLIGTYRPVDRVSLVSLHLVREWQTAEPLLRYGAEAGISYVTYQYSTFSRIHNTGWFGGNYAEHQTVLKTAGLSLRAKLQYPVTRHFAIELAAAGNINAHRSVANLEFGLQFGFLRGWVHPREGLPRRRSNRNR